MADDSMDSGAPTAISVATSTTLTERRLGQATTEVSCSSSSTSSSGCNHAASGTPDALVVDFTSTALWAAIVATIIAALILGAILFYSKRKKRIRERQRIQALLWQVVHGIEDGTIEPAVLERLVYGPDGPVPYLHSPKLFEASVSDRKTESPKKNIVGNAWKWSDIQPTALSPPYALDVPSAPPPKQPLLQWPWRHPHAIPPPDGTSNPVNRTLTSRASRNVDATFLIAMPHASPSGTSNPTPTLLVNYPITLASATPSFRENLIDPILPPGKPFDTGVADPFRAPLSSSNRSGAILSHTRGHYPLNPLSRNLVEPEQPNTTHARWVVRRGLDGGTPAG